MIQAEITRRLRAGEIVNGKDIQQFILRKFNKDVARGCAQREISRCGFRYDAIYLASTFNLLAKRP